MKYVHFKTLISTDMHNSISAKKIISLTNMYVTTWDENKIFIILKV